MKLKLILLIVAALITASCSEEDKQTSTVIFEVEGNGTVQYILHSEDCVPEQLGCFFEIPVENPSLPYEVKVEDLYTDLIGMKVIVADETQKDNISELRITINGESQILKKEEFWWWDDGPYGIQLDFSVTK